MSNFQHPGIRNRYEADVASMSNRELMRALQTWLSMIDEGIEPMNPPRQAAVLREAIWRLQCFTPENQT